MRILSMKKVNADKVLDALAVIALFGLMIAGFWIGYGIGLPTGGDQLMGVAGGGGWLF